MRFIKKNVFLRNFMEELKNEEVTLILFYNREDEEIISAQT